MPDVADLAAPNKYTDPMVAIPLKVVGIPGTETQRVTPMAHGATIDAVTAGAHQPNFSVTVVGPLVTIFVRFGYTFLTSLVGLLTAAMTPEGQKHLYTDDFAHLLVTCMNLSLPIAGLALAKDLLTIFQRLEGKYSLLDR